ncbi:hypothetical protein [Desulfovibrio sp. 86]|uniref:Uncharacterized protein n=1 Tax=uncultured Desulfovibrio sp. TaxID=167968 RepID=A0A212KXZ8_9BACT|nr:hypothetical protein [Desulfovibrio sp. 86]SCM69999.1 conserved hypothetical protein [uncultured Desulfovibrio sp.]VZH35335.1 conserved protein of unknown function [Desulfovibrio sp. 86]
MSFASDLADDLGTFLDLDEFGEEHTIDGIPVVAIVDDAQGSLTTGAAGGFVDAAGLALLSNTRTVFLYESALPFTPVPEQQLELDGEFWLVAAEADSVRHEKGMLILKLIKVYS